MFQNVTSGTAACKFDGGFCFLSTKGAALYQPSLKGWVFDKECSRAVGPHHPFLSEIVRAYSPDTYFSRYMGLRPMLVWGRAFGAECAIATLQHRPGHEAVRLFITASRVPE
jgi:hypothetical protein